MDVPGAELLAELIAGVAYLVLAVALTVIGLALEYASLQSMDGGELTTTVWFAALGAVFLYAGIYGVGYQKLLRTDPSDPSGPSESN